MPGQSIEEELICEETDNAETPLGSFNSARLNKRSRANDLPLPLTGIYDTRYTLIHVTFSPAKVSASTRGGGLAGPTPAE